MKKILIIGLLAVAMLASCGGNEESGSDAQSQSSEIALNGAAVTVAGVTFTPPSDWIDNGPSGMRKADYSFTAVEGETEDASMTVFYFGADQGGAVQANIDRWVAQVKTADSPEPIQKELTVDGMKVTTVEVIGSYSGAMSNATTAEKSENSKLFGAVVEGPEGSVFFKLTGPDKTATKMAEGFNAMIQAVKSQ